MRTDKTRRVGRQPSPTVPLVRGGPIRQPGRIASTLFGLTRRQVLSLLFGQPDQTFYAREVARRTGGAVGAVQRELQILVSAGILRRAESGRQVYYQADSQSPIFQELRSIVAKTDVVPTLAAALAILGPRAELAFVFGSTASGRATNESDIDLFVVGDATLGDAVDALAAAQTALGREINPVVQTRAEFARRVAGGDHFLTRVLEGPRLFVIGDADVLDRLGTQQLADDAHNKPARGRRSAGARSARPARQPVHRPQR